MEITLNAVMAAGTVVLSAVSAYGAAKYAAGRDAAEREAQKIATAALDRKFTDELQVVHERISKTQSEHAAVMQRYSEKLDTLLAGLHEMKGTLETFIKLQGQGGHK